MKYKLSKFFLVLLTFILSCFTAYGAETAIIGDAELGVGNAKFYKGSPTAFSTVTRITNASGVTYTTVTTRSGKESDDNFGTVQAVSRCRFPEESVYRHIGLTKEALGTMKLKFKLKLDDIRNKNLKIAFSYAQDATGTNTLSANFINDEYRYVFCDESGNEYISIGDFVAETTEWQDVEVTLDLSAFTKAKNKNGMIEADWSKAAAIEIASLKSDNVFSVDDTATSIEISYEDIEIDFSAYNHCAVTIDVTNSENESVTVLQSGATITPIVKFDNKKTSDETALVMFAVYKNDLMVKLVPKFITFTHGEPDTIPLESYTLPSDITDYEVFMYLWTDFSEMQAFSEQIHIK